MMWILDWHNEGRDTMTGKTEVGEDEPKLGKEAKGGISIHHDLASSTNDMHRLFF